MENLFIGLVIGIVLRPFLDVGIKIIKNAWKAYKNQ